MGCTHATFLDLRNLSTPVAFPPDDEQVALLQEKGLAHERDYPAHPKAEGRTVVEIAGDASVEEKAARTRAALRAGPDAIYPGASSDGPWQRYADFLLNVPQQSAPGPFTYEDADHKLSRPPTLQHHTKKAPKQSDT